MREQRLLKLTYEQGACVGLVVSRQFAVLLKVRGYKVYAGDKRNRADYREYLEVRDTVL